MIKTLLIVSNEGTGVNVNVGSGVSVGTSVGVDDAVIVTVGVSVKLNTDVAGSAGERELPQIFGEPIQANIKNIVDAR